MMTVACVWVHANVAYTADYVVNLRSMVAKHLDVPHRFVCLCDKPHRLPRSIETVTVTPHKGLAGWWSKIELFKPDRFSDRVLYLDLDTVVVRDLLPIVRFPSAFALIPDAGTFQPKNGLKVIKRFNSSVMVWDVEAVAGLYHGWTPDVAKRLWGDQDYIGEQRPAAQVMPAEWFPRLSELKGAAPSPDARVVLCKVPKNNIAAELYPWVADAWRAA